MLTTVKKILTAPLTRPLARTIRRKPVGSPAAPAWRPRIETLEDRSVPTVIADLSAGNSVVTFYEPSGDADNDAVELRVNTSNGDLEWRYSTNGGATFSSWSNDLDTTVLFTQSARASDLANVVVDLGGGDDSLKLDVNGRDLIRSGLITYDGGTGFNTIQVEGTPVLQSGYSMQGTTYNVGPNASDGRLAYRATGPGADQFMTIDFTNLSPIVTTVPTPQLVVNATGGSNAITYSASDASRPGLTLAKVAVDGFEPINFANQQHLILNALAGDDTIVATNAGRPTGLIDVAVNGGDPTASDKFVLTGGSGDDAFTYTPSTTSLTASLGGGPVTTYLLTGIEATTVDGQGHSAGDSLHVTEFIPYWVPTDGPIGAGDTVVTPTRVEFISVHDVPAAVNDPVATDEDAAADFDVLANDGGLGDAPITLTVLTPPAHGTATVVGNVIHYVPDADYNGTDALTYKVVDANGEESTANVDITVNPVNDAPVAQDGTLTTDEDEDATGTLAATDIDSPALTYSLFGANGGALHGTVTIDDPNTGEYTYTPDANYNGPDSFQFVANDGLLDSAPATVSVTVNAVNDAPVAEDDTGSATEAGGTNNATPGSDATGNVLDNDTDVDTPHAGLAVTEIRAGGTEGAGAAGTVGSGLAGLYGTLTVNADGSYTYVVKNNKAAVQALKAGDTLTDSFNYTVSDGSLTDTAVLEVTITGANDAPVALGGAISTSQDAPASGVLAATDVDSPVLTFSLATPPSHGTVTITDPGTGAYTYTPDAGYSGPDGFTFKASDGDLSSNAGAVSIDVVAPQPPVKVVTQVNAVGQMSGSLVTLYNAQTGAAIRSFDAFPGYAGGVAVATGDVNDDGFEDVIVGAGAGAPGGHVKVFDGATGAELLSFMAFPGYTGGVSVGAGDVNGDGKADVIVGAAGGSAGGHVKVYDGATGAQVRSFWAFPGTTGGVSVAGGDVNGDGKADIVVGAAGNSGGGHVKVFDGSSGAEVRSLFAFPGYTGGVSVGAGDLNGDGFAEVAVGAATSSAGGHVKVFDGQTGAEAQSFWAFPGFTGGVNVAVGGGQLLVGAGPGTGPHAKVYDGATQSEVQSFWAFDPLFIGGVNVG
jgi:VCBS repeat-containing protein